MNALAIAVLGGAGFLLVSLLIDRVFAPIAARKNVQRILKSKASHDPRQLENAKHGTVISDDTGLKITNGHGECWELLWRDVEEIQAFKRDLFSTDLICLAFRKSSDAGYEINEEMAGYHDLVEMLPRHFPKFSTNWFSTVAFPAFKTNRNVIWAKEFNQLPAPEVV